MKNLETISFSANIEIIQFLNKFLNILYLLLSFFLQIGTLKFVSLTYILMDIIPVVSKLNLFFQKEFIDVAMVKVSFLLYVNLKNKFWLTACADKSVFLIICTHVEDK